MKLALVFGALALTLPAPAQSLVRRDGVPSTDPSAREHLTTPRLIHVPKLYHEHYSVSVPKFDRSVGVLIGVDIEMSAVLDCNVEFEANAPSLGPRNYSARVDNDWLLSAPGIDVRLVEPVTFSGRLPIYQTVRFHSQNGLLVSPVSASVPASSIGDFIGTGDIQIPVRMGSVYYHHLGTGHSSSEWRQAFNLQTKITYRYHATGTAVRDLPARGAASITFVRNNQTGRYTPEPTGPLFDSNYARGFRLPLGDDEVVDLDFPPLPTFRNFRMPGGHSVSSIRIDSNGRLLESGSVTASDSSPTVTEFLGSPSAMIAPMWRDLDPGAGGDVFVNFTLAGLSITWHEVPEAGRQNKNTFQVLLSPSGTISFFYVDLDIEGAPALTGITPGNGALDPGVVDLSSCPTVADSTIYEFFTGVTDLNSTHGLGDLVALTAPDRDTDFELQIQGTYGALAQGVLFMGPRGDFGLGQLFGGFAMNEFTMRVLLPLSTQVPMPVNTTLALPIPTDSSLRGVELGMQGVVIDPQITTNPLSIDLTNGLAVRIGG